MGITAVVVSGLKCILPTTTRVDHPPTSQLIEERILLQLLAKRKVQALQAQGVVSLEVLLANKEPEGRSGREQSIVTETEAPRGSRLLLTDKHVRDEGWSREYQRAVCGNTVGESVFVHQPQGGVGLFERARARVAYLCLAYEGDGRSISRSHGRQWCQDDRNHILVRTPKKWSFCFCPPEGRN